MTSANLVWAGLMAVTAASLTAALGAWRYRTRLRLLTDQFQARIARDAEKLSGLKSQVSALNDELKTQRSTVARLTSLTKSHQPAGPLPVSPRQASPAQGLYDGRRAGKPANLGFEDTQILN